MMSERARRRLENTQGTLGAGVNFDGTLVAPKPLFSTLAAPVTSEGCGSIFGPDMGTKKKDMNSARHGPGIQSAIYSDAGSNLEKKRAMQAELGNKRKSYCQRSVPVLIKHDLKYIHHGGVSIIKLNMRESREKNGRR